MELQWRVSPDGRNGYAKCGQIKAYSFMRAFPGYVLDFRFFSPSSVLVDLAKTKEECKDLGEQHWQEFWHAAQTAPDNEWELKQNDIIKTEHELHFRQTGIFTIRPDPANLRQLRTYFRYYSNGEAPIIADTIWEAARQCKAYFRPWSLRFIE
ncbi:MAG: hypothetical protein M3Q97_09030 [Bacteroidota bacterium]|nr:hypothetical protein [Bacteroidota bacterium]